MVSELRAKDVANFVSKYGREKAAFHFRLHIKSVDRYLRLANVRVDGSKKEDVRHVLVIGDLHEPFTLDGYRDFCYDMYKKHECTDVVFIGDIIDNHYSSFHDSDPDGHSAGQELALAKISLNKWYDMFPEAKICIGNHDSIPDRKGFYSGLSKKWIKSIDEVLAFDGWEYSDYFLIDGVMYTHGTGRKARQRGQKDMVNVVQGHYHSESYTEHTVGRVSHLWAMQVGCGIDDKAYAMAYAKHFPKSHINCGIVKDNGRQPILEYMDL